MVPSDVNCSREDKNCAAALHSLSYHIKRHLKVVSFGSAVNRDSATDTLSSTCLESRGTPGKKGNERRSVKEVASHRLMHVSNPRVERAKLIIASQQQAIHPHRSSLGDLSKSTRVNGATFGGKGDAVDVLGNIKYLLERTA